MVYEALWANQYYQAIETAYTNGKKYDDPYIKKVSSTCYSRAVNNIVDIWYSIWAQSGGKIDPAKDAKPKYFPPYFQKRILETEHLLEDANP